MSFTYSAAIFNARNIEEAKRIILTPEDGLSTAERWEKETPYLVGLMGSLNLSSESVVLDYGCGIGRLSKALIETFGCRVVGADISANMRTMASFHVASERFMACHPSMLSALGSVFDAALSVWVLQHCHKPQEDIAAIRGGLKTGGGLFVVNEQSRFVPALQTHWVTDGLDIAGLLDSSFERKETGKLDPAVVLQAASDRTYWARYVKR